MSELIPQFGGTLWTLAAFVVALVVIVTVHEFGHYIIGRFSGIRAEVFSVGFGPRLLSRRDRHGTLWQVAAIPLGGYVRFLGDDNVASAGSGRAVEPARRRQTLHGAPLWARFSTLLAGPVFNFILSILIFAGFALVQGLPADRVEAGKILPTPPGIVNELQPGDIITGIEGQSVTQWPELWRIADALPPAAQQQWQVQRNGKAMTVTGPAPMPARIGGVAPRSAAADAGLKEGDVVLAIDGTDVTRFSQMPDLVAAAEGDPIVMSIWRPDSGVSDYRLVPKRQDLPKADGGYENRWLIGVTGGGGYITPATRSAGVVESLWLGVAQTWSIITSSLAGMWAMISGQIGSCNLGGAISIAESTGQAASSGADSFLWWIAVLSAAIGFLNLLPIPVLDGGHLMFYSWEAITGRPPADKVMNILTTLGMAAVLTLMIFGLTNDLFCP